MTEDIIRTGAKNMPEEINEMIGRYGLEEDLEHIIIPLPRKDGKNRRCFILKRKFMRIVYPEGHYVDFPLEDVIEAIIKFPELLLSEALYLLHKERDDHASEVHGDARETADSRGNL